MASASHLGRKHRAHVRDRVIEAAVVGLRNRANVHYTEGPARWSGIVHHRVAHRGEYPVYSDCSAFATWCLWNGLYLLYNVGDVVNGAHWSGGFTGTMLHHGKRVRGPRKRGDLVIYGHYPTGSHVAVYVGGGMVISHGSEGGPYKLPVHYRPDVLETRRFI